jgi:hypothetical protein
MYFSFLILLLVGLAIRQSVPALRSRARIAVAAVQR